MNRPGDPGSPGGGGARLRRSAASFRWAGRGIAFAWAGTNFRVQVGAGAMALLTGGLIGLSAGRMALVLLCCGAVLGAEVVNTAVEGLCDLVDDLHGLGFDPRIGRVKDLAAGACLVISVAAALVGLLLFVPPLLTHLG